jgi:ABC-type multidrug transport system fused ATPase/permease subunit
LSSNPFQDKARLLVTNQLQYLPRADRILVLDAGRVVAQGTYEQCLSNDVFARLLSEHGAGAEAAAEATQQAADADGATSAVSSGSLPRVDTMAVMSRTAVDAAKMVPGAEGRPDFRGLARDQTFARVDDDRNAANANSAANGDRNPQGKYGKQLTRFETMLAEGRKGSKPLDEEAEGTDGKGGKAGKSKDVPKKGALMVKEDQEEGQVTGKVYGRYVSAYGFVSFVALIVLWSSEQSVRILTNWWLSRWTNSEVIARYTGGDSNRTTYVGVYISFALSFMVLTLIRSTTNLLSALRASKVIHAKSLTSLVRAPVSFFDTTPIGRILNRFSKDTDDVDFLLSMSMSEFGNCIMQLLSTVIFIAVIQPLILVGIAPLGIVYYILQNYFRRSFIELQRLDAVSRSPIYAHFSETLAGVDTIRAYRLAETFARSSDAKVDSNHRAYFSNRMANEWLSMRLDIIGGTIVFLTAVLAIVNKGNISPALAALTLSEALDVTLFLKAAVTSGATFETRFNSVERLSAYWQLPQEAPAKSAPGAEPPAEWPQNGMIEYKDVWMRYRPELDPVLKGREPLSLFLYYYYYQFFIDFFLKETGIAVIILLKQTSTLPMLHQPCRRLLHGHGRRKGGHRGPHRQRQVEPHRLSLPHCGTLCRADLAGWYRSPYPGSRRCPWPYCCHPPRSNPL